MIFICAKAIGAIANMHSASEKAICAILQYARNIPALFDETYNSG